MEVMARLIVIYTKLKQMQKRVINKMIIITI